MLRYLLYTDVWLSFLFKIKHVFFVIYRNFGICFCLTQNFSAIFCFFCFEDIEQNIVATLFATVLKQLNR